MYNEDYEYAMDKLPGTIVRLAANMEPVLINDVVVREKICLASKLNIPKQNGYLHVRLADLDLSSPPLGFINYKSNAYYMSRIPKRRDWKQGIRRENCHLYGQVLFTSICGMPLYNCIMGKYPTFEKALLSVSNKNLKVGKTLAWNRHWSVATGGYVTYKAWGLVGIFDVDKNDIAFSPGFAFLRENFEESIK